MQILEDNIDTDSLYLLDEPEVSLSPQNQVKLAEEINKMARYLGIQFIIATHSPFMLGILNAKIYNLDTKNYKVQKWTELENVRFFYDFFKKRENEFFEWLIIMEKREKEKKKGEKKGHVLKTGT